MRTFYIGKLAYDIPDKARCPLCVNVSVLKHGVAVSASVYNHMRTATLCNDITAVHNALNNDNVRTSRDFDRAKFDLLFNFCRDYHCTDTYTAVPTDALRALLSALSDTRNTDCERGQRTAYRRRDNGC